jgi:hypothetical protein
MAQNVFIHYIFLLVVVCANINTSFDRTRQAASGTRVFVFGTSI